MRLRRVVVGEGMVGGFFLTGEFWERGDVGFSLLFFIRERGGGIGVRWWRDGEGESHQG